MAIARRLHAKPRALAVKYSVPYDQIIVCLDSNLTLSFNPMEIPEFRRVPLSCLMHITIEDEGHLLVWPELNVKLWLPSLLAGKFVSSQTKKDSPNA